nr:MAG: hypothetical protein [Apis mellifra filamentous-like virus]
MFERVRERVVLREKLKTVGTALMVFIGLMSLVLIGLLATTFSFKMIRTVLDAQYGKVAAEVWFDRNDLTKLDELLDEYKAGLRRQGKFVTWPRLLNFFEDWERQEILIERAPKTLWYRKRETTPNTKRNLLMFVHGGGMISGSPIKFNSLHWTTTMAWLGGCGTNVLTDFLSLDYRLAPEHTSPAALIDCLEQMALVCKDKFDRVIMIGFSAGALLTMQMVVSMEMSRKGENAFQLDDMKWPKSIDENVSEMHVFLVGPFLRLNHLVMNKHRDVSPALRSFTRVFTSRPDEQDPFYEIYRSELTMKRAKSVTLMDVPINSFSNHCLQMGKLLRLAGHKDVRVFIWSGEQFHVDQEMLEKIDEYDIKVGRSRHKFVKGGQVSVVHYHFFPFIVVAEAAWLTTREILKRTLASQA